MFLLIKLSIQLAFSAAETPCWLWRYPHSHHTGRWLATTVVHTTGFFGVGTDPSLLSKEDGTKEMELYFCVKGLYNSQEKVAPSMSWWGLGEIWVPNKLNIRKFCQESVTGVQLRPCGENMSLSSFYFVWCHLYFFLVLRHSSLQMLGPTLQEVNRPCWAAFSLLQQASLSGFFSESYKKQRSLCSCTARMRAEDKAANAFVSCVNASDPLLMRWKCPRNSSSVSFQCYAATWFVQHPTAFWCPWLSYAAKCGQEGFTALQVWLSLLAWCTLHIWRGWWETTAS